MALIDEEEVTFGEGLNILTGETGAGKSIIIGSIAVALGAKADHELIRQGAEYALVELTFTADTPVQKEKLKSLDLPEEEDGLILIKPSEVADCYMEMYNASRGRRLVTLKTAVPAPDLCEQVKDMLQGRLGGEVVLNAEVDPALIGGFILIIDDKLLDASVSRQLEEIRRQFMDKNKRIV